MENTDNQNEEHETAHNQSVPVFTAISVMLSVFFLCHIYTLLFKLQCNHTPYYSLQYIFINQWEVTNSFPYLSIPVFNIVCFHGIRFCGYYHLLYIITGLLFN